MRGINLWLNQHKNRLGRYVAGGILASGLGFLANIFQIFGGNIHDVNSFAIAYFSSQIPHWFLTPPLLSLFVLLILLIYKKFTTPPWPISLKTEDWTKITEKDKQFALIVGLNWGAWLESIPKRKIKDLTLSDYSRFYFQENGITKNQHDIPLRKVCKTSPLAR